MSRSRRRDKRMHENANANAEFYMPMSRWGILCSGELPDSAKHQDLIEIRRHLMEGHSAKFRDRLIWFDLCTRQLIALLLLTITISLDKLFFWNSILV